MDLEDKTPQNENRDPIAEISFLTLGKSFEVPLQTITITVVKNNIF